MLEIFAFALPYYVALLAIAAVVGTWVGLIDGRRAALQEKQRQAQPVQVSADRFVF